MAELHHECGIVALYHYGQDQIGQEDAVSQPTGADPNAVSKLIPRMLQDIQNRGQLAAGITTYKPYDKELLTTHKHVGSVTEVFRTSRPDKYKKIMANHVGPAAIGHVRYATCGKDDPHYAQPFERVHLEKRKWFSFGFNGQLANYAELRDEINSQGEFHLARETDTETMMHLMSQIISDNPSVKMRDLIARLAPRLDGAYNIVFMNAAGSMFVSRDPNGFRPLCYAERDGFFAAASESVALANLGFEDNEIKDLEPGSAAIIENGEFTVQKYAEPHRSHCFFEWIYFANVCSKLDGQSVYLTRKVLGEELAAQEKESTEGAIVVPVPDTARSAAEGMAFALGIPCLEGLMRHRALGRTFIEGAERERKAKMKYIPLPDVMRGKKVFLVDDTIVRSTTMKVLVEQILERGEAAEVHIRVACPPIMAPCFYGIDMPKVRELFAPNYGSPDAPLSEEAEQAMAKHFGANSLRYLPVSSIVKALHRDGSELCQACLNGKYPTKSGRELYQLSLEAYSAGTDNNGDRLVEGKANPSLVPARL